MMSYHMILSYDRILENLQRTNTQTDKHTETSITEATHIPCGSSGGVGQLPQEPQWPYTAEKN